MNFFFFSSDIQWPNLLISVCSSVCLSPHFPDIIETCVIIKIMSLWDDNSIWDRSDYLPLAMLQQIFCKTTHWINSFMSSSHTWILPEFCQYLHEKAGSWGHLMNAQIHPVRYSSLPRGKISPQYPSWIIGNLF